MTRPAETTSATRSDADLLMEFVARRHEAAFAEIVRRHGGMVLSVCRSVLAHTQDAEDAAQAVFLTLAQRASSLQGRPTLVGWLCRVAWYVATRAAEARAVRRRHEQEAGRMKPHATMPDDEAIPLDLLYAALADLPERYQLPLLLHHVEGRSEQETAHLLGCGLSAVSMRLNRGRESLRKRLVKRGVAGSAVGVVGVLASHASAEMTPTFVTSVSQAAVSLLAGKAATVAASASAVVLSKAALNMLFWAKMKLVAIVAGTVLLVGGVGAGTYIALAGGPTPSAPAAGRPSATPPVAAQREVLTITQADNGKTLRAAFGQTIAVTLVGNQANTGWEVSGQEGDSVKPSKFGGKGGNQDIPALEFTPTKDATDEALGTYTFRYKAVAGGQTTLRFTYLTPGGPVPKARKATAKIAAMQVTIDVGKAPAAPPTSGPATFLGSLEAPRELTFTRDESASGKLSRG